MPSDEPDLAYLKAVYPDAAAIFAYDATPTKKPPTIVIDTNVLLAPYRLSSTSLAAIRDGYSRLATEGRLGIPGQVAREFALQRPERLKELVDQLVRGKSLRVPASSYPLLSGLKEYAELCKTEQALQVRIDNYREAVEAVLDLVRAWEWDDPVSRIYRGLFNGPVIVDPTFDEADIQKDLAFRTRHRLPPGYKDAAKRLNSIGDLIIWHTILAIGKERRVDVTFISGEEKSDWWHRTSEGPLYPRFELAEEFKRESGGAVFRIARLTDLLKELGATKEVIADVRAQETRRQVFSSEDFVRAFPSEIQTSIVAFLAWAPFPLNSDLLMLDNWDLRLTSYVAPPGSRFSDLKIGPPLSWGIGAAIGSTLRVVFGDAETAFALASEAASDSLGLVAQKLVIGFVQDGLFSATLVSGDIAGKMKELGMGRLLPTSSR